jgi:hypothetical protein
MIIDKDGLKRDKMKQVKIAFDIDGTLRDNHTDKMIANESIRNLLIILSSFKNVWIHVWSGGGELYAIQAAKALAIDRYVDSFSSKADGPEVDIAIDDIQECAMAPINLIVREK